MNTKAVLITCSLAALTACSTGSDSAPGSAGSGPSAGASNAGASSAGDNAGGSSGSGAAAGASAGSGNMAGLAGAPPVVTGLPQPGSAFVHLFEWKWTDIARECETYLGPAGFAAVQVSPPSEHAVLGGAPWYQRYQTVSYELTQSRSGSAAEFQDMVARCARVGVGIYVDAVINHMTAQTSGTGSAGTKYTKYEYPNLYTKTDFHSPTCAIMGADYVGSADNVRNCELVGLADLNTGSDPVRDKIAGYLNALVDLGVAGFRIDAAKHMAVADVDAIVQRVNQHASAGHQPFVFLEVIDNGGEAIAATEYLTVGQSSGQAAFVTDFQYRSTFFRFIGSGTLSQFRPMASSRPALPSAQALVFTNNHDTERNEELFYQDGVAYDLANVLMLAWPYGYPSLMSSYAFVKTSAGIGKGPPSDAMGKTTLIYAAGGSEPTCSLSPQAAVGSWVCQHRAPYVAPMLAFRKATVGTEVLNFWDNGKNQIAFGLGDKGFVAINLEATAIGQELTTGLPAGSYCDVLTGGVKNGACAGATVTVDASGKATLAVPPMSALAIQFGQKL